MYNISKIGQAISCWSSGDLVMAQDCGACHFFLDETFLFKAIFHPNIQFLSLFTHPHENNNVVTAKRDLKQVTVWL